MKRDHRRRPLLKRAPSLARRRVRHAGAIAGLWVFALAVYSNSFRGELSADAAALVHDPRIAAATATAVQASFHQQYWHTGVSGLYRPLATLSYMFNYAVLGNGVSPAGYHWLNFLLHIANTGLVYLLGFVIFQRFGASLFFAGLWSVHPVMTESVTNVAGRPDLLAGLGLLSGLLAHIRARYARGWRRIPWLALLAFCFAVGLFSKENAIVLLAVMAAYDIAWRPPGWRDALPGYAAAFVSAAVFLYLRARVLAGAPPLFALFTDNPLMAAGWWTARFTALHVIGKYIGLLIWPGALSCDYSYNSIPIFGWTMRTSGDWATAAAIAALVAGLVTALCYLRNRAAWFFLALFAIALAPTANLIFRIGTIMAERFLYLPAIGFAGCVVLASGRWGASRPRTCAVGAVALCCLLAARTYARNNEWSTEANLWKSAVEAGPDNAKARLVTAQVALDPKHRDVPRAAADADRAIAILEPLPDAENVAEYYATAARVYRLMGESLPDELGRMAWFRKAYATLVRAERIDDASIRSIRSRLRGSLFAMDDAEVYAELGRIYSHLGQPLQAVAALEKARIVRRGPPEDDDSIALAGVYASADEWREAAVTMLEGSIVNPDNSVFVKDLPAIYAKIDPQGCEIRNGALNLACSAAHADVCTALANVVRLRRARGERKLAEIAAESAQRQFDCSVSP